MSSKEATIYVQDEPDIAALADAYSRTLTDLGPFFTSTRESYDYRRNIWPGKSKDLRKNTADAFPWKGASDTEVRLIDERINTYIALFMSSLNRANIRAYPVESGDIGRARVVSSFLKWMASTYIPSFKKQMERGGNYFMERGLMISYVGWQKAERPFLQRLDINQLAERSVDFAKMILDGSMDDEIVQMLQQHF